MPAMPVGRHGVEIDCHFELFAFAANVFGEQLDARCTGCDYDGGAVERFAQRGFIARSVGFELGVGNQLANVVAHLLCFGELREATRTSAPSRASSRTTRRPTEPVAASTVTV